MHLTTPLNGQEKCDIAWPTAILNQPVRFANELIRGLRFLKEGYFKERISVYTESNEQGHVNI